MTTNILRPFFLAAFAATLTLTTHLRAAVPPAENLLPSDTLFFLAIPDCAALRTAAHQSPQWLFWSDPAMKPFHDKFMGKFEESFIAPLEQSLGVKLADFADLPQGQLTFAVTQNGWTGGDDPLPGMVLLLDTRDKSDLLKTNLDALKKKWTDAGKPMRTEDVRGISFSVVTISSNDISSSLSGLFPRRAPVRELGKETKPEKPAELVVGQFESLLIVGNSVKAVEPIAAHLSGSLLPALNDDAVFAADKLSQFRDAPLYYGWLNAKTLFYVIAHTPPTPPNPAAPRVMPQPQWDKILDATGLTAVKSASFAYRETREGSQVSFFIAAPQASRKGLLKIFAASHESAVPQSFVPVTAVKFWRWRLDGQDGWAAFEKMLGEISPLATAGLNSAIDMANANARQKDPDFDLRKNLIDNLGDDFINYQKAPTGTSPADLNNPPSLFLIGVDRGAPAATAINDLLLLSMSRRQKPPEPRDFQGHKIYTVPLPGPRVPGAAAPARSLYIASSSGYVALSTDVSTLEEYFRSAEKPPKPLSGTPGLVDAAQHVGGVGGGLFGYQNQREVLGVLFKTLKNPASNDGGGGLNPMAALPKAVRDWLDFSLLPDYDQVSKYFYFSVYAGNTTADGLSFKAFAPRPPQMK
jgi:hypothetical protein